MKTASTAPVEKKVAATVAGGLIGIITWILVTFVPAFHHGIPAPLATFLPMILTGVVATGAAWQAKHSPREEEILQAAMRHLQSSGFLAALTAAARADVSTGFADLERLASRPAAGTAYGSGGGGGWVSAGGQNQVAPAADPVPVSAAHAPDPDDE